MKLLAWFLAALLIASALQGCREDADSFFSGRPSGMAMAHNRMLAGTLATMVDLLRIPQRFPEADESQREMWRGSVVAWWNAETGRSRMLAALPHLSEEELRCAEGWLTVESGEPEAKDAAALDAVKAAIIAARKH
jgi:hypothetical protein